MRHPDRDGVYEIDPRDVDLDDRDPWPRERLPPPAIDYDPADDDEIGAREHFAELQDEGCATPGEAVGGYRSFVRRHRWRSHD